MYEYRLYGMSLELKQELDRHEIQLAEELFHRRKSWLVYTERELDELIKAFDISFDRKNTESVGWETNWLNYIEDGWLTDKVFYCFRDVNFDDDRVVIRINPALAFGTGSHPTTKLAAKLLERVIKSASILDIGTGSGILSIMASKLGCKTVYACDNDPQAIMNAKENIALNGCDDVYIWAGGIESVKPTLKPQVVVANILMPTLQQIHPQVLTLHPKFIVYSGILKKDGSDFVSSIYTYGYELEQVVHMNEWSAVSFKSSL
jgi:ribosomal protein L11 methyltransferase